MKAGKLSDSGDGRIYNFRPAVGNDCKKGRKAKARQKAKKGRSQRGPDRPAVLRVW